MNTAAAASLPVQHLPAPGNRPVRVWLYIVALMILAMVVVGGATRLTNSGLSITEWQPIHGVIPPLDDAEWQEEFAKYKQIPEYKVLNRDMDLAGFKRIDPAKLRPWDFGTGQAVRDWLAARSGAPVG